MRAAVLCLALLNACGAYDDLPLLEVGHVEPSEVEPGGALRIHGRGFPLGREPEIALRGFAYRPGSKKVEFEARLTGVVQSESLIEIPFDAPFLDALGGRATVDGELRVAFPAADGHREVFASQRVRIDFLPDTPTELRARSIRQERTSTEPIIARAFGLELSREELGTVGVGVISVDAGSLAAKQGVRPGDTVVGLDGLRIYSWRDFVPDPSTSESTVFLTRDGLRGVHALRWPHEVTERSIDRIDLAFFVFLGLILGWVSPAALGIRMRFSSVAWTAWMTRSSLALVFAALLITVSSLQWATMWILALGTFAALFTLATKDRAGGSSFALAVVSTLTVMSLARTAHIPVIVAAQNPPFLHWYLFQSPASFLAFAVYLHALGAVSNSSRLSASLYGAAAAVLAAVLFLGGMHTQSVGQGIGLLFVKALAVLVAAQGFQLDPKAAATMSALGLALAAVDFSVDLDAVFPQWSALVVGCICVLAARALVPRLRPTSSPVSA